MKRLHYLLPVAIVMMTLVGCASTNLSDDNEEANISWLIEGLEDSGLSIESGGAATLSRRSDASSRLFLNNRDIVDVYEFGEADIAYEEGQTLIRATQDRDVYVKESLMVVHFVNPGSGVRPALNELLGRTL